MGIVRYRLDQFQTVIYSLIRFYTLCSGILWPQFTICSIVITKLTMPYYERTLWSPLFNSIIETISAQTDRSLLDMYISCITHISNWVYWNSKLTIAKCFKLPHISSILSPTDSSKLTTLLANRIFNFSTYYT